MRARLPKGEKFKFIPNSISRHTPIIISEINNPEVISLFEKTIPKVSPYITLEQIESPKQLFNFLKENNQERIIVRADIFAMRKNYLDIMQGAVCSSPDSMTLWKVCLGDDSFTFKGEIVLCTNKTRLEIESNKRFYYFARDCQIF